MANNTQDLPQGQQLHWLPTDQFILDGEQFAALHNGLQAIINTPAYREDFDRAKNTLAIGQMFDITNKKLQEGVAAGFVKPQAPPTDGIVEPVDTTAHTMD